MSGWLQTADKLAAGPSSQVTKAAQWFISWIFEPDRLLLGTIAYRGPSKLFNLFEPSFSSP